MAANTLRPPPPRCVALTQIDLKDDLPKAKMAALTRRWPHCFKIFEQRKQNPACDPNDQELQDAYLLDLVEQGHRPTVNRQLDPQLIFALHKAASRFAKRQKSKVTDLAIYLIAFSWELGWCYLPDKEIAQKLQEILQVPFSHAQVKHYRFRTLGLVAKHRPGPPPNSP